MVEPLAHRLPGHLDGRRGIRHRLAAGQEVHGRLVLRGQRPVWRVGMRRRTGASSGLPHDGLRTSAAPMRFSPDTEMSFTSGTRIRGTRAPCLPWLGRAGIHAASPTRLLIAGAEMRVRDTGVAALLVRQVDLTPFDRQHRGVQPAAPCGAHRGSRTIGADSPVFIFF